MPKPENSVSYRMIGVLIIILAAPGDQELVLCPARDLDRDLMYFKSLRLERLP